MEKIWGLQGIAVCLWQIPNLLQSAKVHFFLRMVVRTFQGEPKKMTIFTAQNGWAMLF